MKVSDEVAGALRDGRAVVALETTIVAHGFPRGDGVEVGRECERRVREAGAAPATVGVLEGEIRVGLTSEDLDRFTPEARKVGPRDLAACAAQGAVGATTVGGTLAVCRAAGIRVLGTGGIGGVHRDPRDISPDLAQLARTEAVVVSSGIKSLLDVEATSELLETLAIPVLGFGTDELPLFYAARGGPPVSARVDSADEVAGVSRGHWELGGGGVLVARPPTESLDDVEPLIQSALLAAAAQGIVGQALTPFVLETLHRESGGRTLEANRKLVADNVALAAEVARCLSA